MHLTSDSFNDLDNVNCEWHIKMPLNQKLKLEFIKEFGITDSINCSTDFLEVCFKFYFRFWYFYNCINSP